MDFTDLLSGCGWDFFQATWRVWVPLALIVGGLVLIFMYDNLLAGSICIGAGLVLGLYFWRNATRYD